MTYFYRADMALEAADRVANPNGDDASPKSAAQHAHAMQEIQRANALATLAVAYELRNVVAAIDAHQRP